MKKISYIKILTIVFVFAIIFIPLCIVYANRDSIFFTSRYDGGSLQGDYLRSYRTQDYKTWAKSLTQEEKYAIAEYTESQDEINNYLRRAEGWENINKSVVMPEIAGLDSAIRKFKLDRPIRVMRGVDLDTFGDKLNDLQSLIGETFSDKSFFSTSLLEEAAIMYKPVKMYIFVPAGAGFGAYIANFSTFKDEQEFLFARNSKFIIMNAVKNDNDTYTIDMALLLE